MPNDSDEGQRKLAAILAADVAGYSRLMADDERATVAALKQARGIFREHVEVHAGRLIDTTGDSVLAEFRSPVEAVQCAVEIQRQLKTVNAPVPDHRKMFFRIGVNLGDVIEEADGTIYGDGVNVAARLEGLAEPGGIMLADVARQMAEGKLDVGLEDAGAHEVKNIAKPVRAWRVLLEGEVAIAAPPKVSRPKFVVGAVVVAILGGVVAWHLLSSSVDQNGVVPEVAETDGELPPLPAGPSIAVLPFDNLSGDSEQEYFADGLAEDILTRLAAFRDLKVIARNSSFQFKGKAVDVRDIGRDLGADYVLEGSVRRDVTSIRVSAQLLESRDGGHVWSKTYDRDLSTGSIFAIQDEISKQVVAALGGTEGAIVASEITRIRGVPTQNLLSYDCVSLAKQYGMTVTPELHLEARDCLQGVVAKEPDYVDALAWLGTLYVEEIWSGFNPRQSGPSSLEAAFEVLTRAVQLDPNHQSGRSALALAYYLSGDADKFYDEARKAINANPNDVETLALMAQYIGYSGRWQESKALTQRLRNLVTEVPIWHNYTEFNYHYRDKDYTAAAASARATLEIEHWGGPWGLALAYAGADENDKAMEALARARTLEPNLSNDVVRGLADALFLDQSHIALLLDGHARLLEIEQSLAPSRPVIAVLPFDNMSGDPEQDYFADGITEDIITRLAQFPDILVLGRNTTFQFKGQAVDIKTIAETLGADYVVEGSIRRGGDTVRVTAQLLGGDGGTHLWAETYDRALDPAKIFSIQDEITETVAVRIGDVHGAISRAQSARVERQVPKLFSSYDCTLRAHEFVRQVGPDTHSVARDCLENVVKTEPDYAEARAYLGNLYLLEIAVGLNPLPESSLERALSTLERAVALDPNSGIAHVIYAQALYLTDDPRRAIREAEQALRLEPNNSDVIGWAGEVFSNTGAYDRTVEIMNRLVILNPKYPGWMNWNMAKVHLARGEFNDAISRLETNQMNWYYLTHAFLAAAHCASDDLDRGRIALDAALSAYPEFRDAYWRVVYFWQKGANTRPLIEALTSGLETCGWDVPPDPGRAAFAPTQ